MTESVAVPAQEQAIFFEGKAAESFKRPGLFLLLLGAGGVPLSLLWDYSWECTIGVDLFWAPPHTAIYISIALAGLGALAMLGRNTPGMRLGPWRGSFGTWLTLWGVAAFASALLFERWWQGAYGLSAGIWHPPQICKTVSFFAILAGAWSCCAAAQNRNEGSLLGKYGFLVAGGFLLVLINVVSVTGSYANRQHSGAFYELTCVTYTPPLVALAVAGRVRFSATTASLVYVAVWCCIVWLLPLFSARPMTAPVYNPLDHMMPPPFPLLLILPALATDALLRGFSWPGGWTVSWLKAGVAGLVVAVVFILTQWFFAEFLLSGAAKNWIFAGGGQHWPFFLKISDTARQAFWTTAGDELNEGSCLAAIMLAVLSARLGLWAGAWMKGLRR